MWNLPHEVELRLRSGEASALGRGPDVIRCQPTGGQRVFGQDASVSILTYRSWNLWLLDYPAAALRDTVDALKNAREIGQAATLMF